MLLHGVQGLPTAICSPEECRASDCLFALAAQSGVRPIRRRSGRLKADAGTDLTHSSKRAIMRQHNRPLSSVPVRQRHARRLPANTCKTRIGTQLETVLQTVRHAKASLANAVLASTDIRSCREPKRDFFFGSDARGGARCEHKHEHRPERLRRTLFRLAGRGIWHTLAGGA